MPYLSLNKKSFNKKINRCCFNDSDLSAIEAARVFETNVIILYTAPFLLKTTQIEQDSTIHATH